MARHWDFFSSNQPTFGHQYAATVRSRGFFSWLGTLAHGSLVNVEVGFGNGRLVEFVTKRGGRFMGIDSSPGTVAAARAKWAGHEGVDLEVGGVDHVPCDDGAVGTIYAFEILEHLAPKELHKALAEFHRVLAPGGRVVATVPNDEDLDLETVMCPDCQCVFHRVQHQQSFDTNDLDRWFRDAGFRPLRVSPIWPRVGRFAWSFRLRNWIGRLRRHKGESIVVVATRD